MSWLAELKKRKVFRVAAAYAVVGWLLVQVASVVLPALHLPPWTLTFTTVLLILGFPVALLLAWSFDVVREPGSKAPDTAASHGAPDLAPRSVVVLPFANMSEDVAQTHFADGIVEDLTTRLQALPGLKVMSRQSAFAYQGRKVDARTISRELGCRYVVEGSVRKIDDHMRVTAQLIDAARDEHVWAERYDRQLEDAFALQDEICDHILAAIKSRLAPADETEAPAAAVATSAAAAPEIRARPGVVLRRLLGARWAIPGALAFFALAAALTWTLQQRSKERWAREEALPRLEALIEKDEYLAAADLAATIGQVIPNDPRLKSLEPAYTAAVSLASSPSGATVHYRPYSSTEADWRPIGTTPLTSLTVPRGFGLWKLERQGSATAVAAMRNPGLQLGNYPEPAVMARMKTMDLTVHLAEASTAPADMVFVQSEKLPVAVFSEETAIDLPPYYIDRLEVTNREFKEFVDAGGYTRAELWRDLPFGDGFADWSEAVARFVDVTGRPGPSTWEAGTYRDGTGDHPVAGVSWFEAVAYARFRDKELPTAYHWYRAAYSLNERLESLASAIIAASNFDGRGTAPVGSRGGIGPYGTYDMAGNVREWLWNESAHGRWIAGGAFDQAPYVFIELDAIPAWDRSPGNGFRCMRTKAGQSFAAELREPVVQKSLDLAALVPITDETYSVLAQQLEYAPAPLDPQVESVKSTNPLWTRERITLSTGYDDERFNVQLFLPTGGSPPYQAIFYLPHAGYMVRPFDSDDFDPTVSAQPLDFVLKSGRALVVVALEGAYERHWPAARRASMSDADRFRLRLRHSRQDLGRTIDYLSTRKDIDVGRLGWFGVSYGAQALSPVLAVEKRFRAAVLDGAGIYLWDMPAAEQYYNYVPRITQPVLMLNGRWDIDVPLETQQLYFALLGTAPGDKKHMLFDAGHGQLPHNQLVRASLDWYDRYLGPTRAVQ